MADEPGRIGIEAQIEDATGLADVAAIAGASPRLEALVFGPADFMASIGMRSLQVGAEPAGYTGGDAYHYARMRILVAARAHGLAAIDGPHLAIGDLDGLARRRLTIVRTIDCERVRRSRTLSRRPVECPVCTAMAAPLECGSGLGHS